MSNIDGAYTTSQEWSQQLTQKNRCILKNRSQRDILFKNATLGCDSNVHLCYKNFVTVQKSIKNVQKCLLVFVVWFSRILHCSIDLITRAMFQVQFVVASTGGGGLSDASFEGPAGKRQTTLRNTPLSIKQTYYFIFDCSTISVYQQIKNIF